MAAVLTGWVAGAIEARPFADGVEQRPWAETRTAHFNIYSSGSAREVNKLAGRLEQFCQAYAQLAGAEAVDSPPIVVLAFPDQATMRPFLPLYEGQPGNMAAFFNHGVDENLIVLSLPERGMPDTDLRVIFHEYSHLLFRRNDQVWPLWLKEGMAEIYSTFQTSGRYVRIASPIGWHLRLLHEKPMIPLGQLFAVKTDSPDYNETDRQGVFYAESWLLTQYLMAGDDPQYRARFGQFTQRLRAGEAPVAAFTNALQATLPTVQSKLYYYLVRGAFAPINLTLGTNLAKAVNMTSRWLTPAEVDYRLGDELMRIRRPDVAAARFEAAQRLAPGSPLPEEGLGLLASQTGDHAAALQHLQAAIRLGSGNYLTYYNCAYEEFHATAPDGEHFHRVEAGTAAEVRSKIEESVRLMPNFGPAQEFFGFFELVQGDNMADAGQFLERAIQLEPQNLSYLLTLAQYQYRMQNPALARQTLAPLFRPGVTAELRASAERLRQEMDRPDSP